MTDPFLRTILWNALFLCILLHIDTYLVPRVGRPEKVIDEHIFRSRTRSGSFGWVVQTDKHTYYTDYELYDKTEVGDTLLIQYSRLLHARQAIETNHGGIRMTYNNGYLYGVSCRIFLWALMIAIIAMLRMVKRIDYAQGKINLTICFAVMALSQLIFYFDLL